MEGVVLSAPSQSTSRPQEQVADIAVDFFYKIFKIFNYIIKIVNRYSW